MPMLCRLNSHAPSEGCQPIRWPTHLKNIPHLCRIVPSADVSQEPVEGLLSLDSGAAVPRPAGPPTRHASCLVLLVSCRGKVPAFLRNVRIPTRTLGDAS